MRIRSTLLTTVVAGMLFGLTACGGANDEQTEPQTTAPTTAAPEETTESDGTTEAAAEPAEIGIKDFEFTLPDSVAPGAEITVTNEDNAAHTVTATEQGDFDTEIQGGETATFTAPSEPGSYPLECTFHPSMTGTLVVE
ncbi:cupredoxin domain-containing protein [Haloechinothrix sp. YIM 98757]|uniref:Cupredoxin domain-containing protein n=1 Tax=Haloechinothrix aidingensis TaxID=2752311 RepID=A0A838ACP2_9PSEU|nr:cupredoxin domain-containing protein [Haloechinothrix aidingensis]MBA0127034.1 cupredoxin domain-containing protein [Haloechinothrix aidingensis]